MTNACPRRDRRQQAAAAARARFAGFRPLIAKPLGVGIEMVAILSACDRGPYRFMGPPRGTVSG